MILKEFIVKALAEIDGAQLQSGVIHMDIAVWPTTTGVEVVTPRSADLGLTRISFDVKVSERASNKESKS